MRTKPSLLGLATGSAAVVGAFLGLAILANAFAVYFVAQELRLLLGFGRLLGQIR
jgi:hypothetical protein